MDTQIGQTSHFRNGKYAVLESLCFSEFLSYYYVESKINETSNCNDSQPVVLNNEVVEGNYNSYIYPKSVPLMSSNEKLKGRTVRDILRYHETIQINIQRNMPNIYYSNFIFFAMKAI